jgi:hypothetical protein
MKSKKLEEFKLILTDTLYIIILKRIKENLVLKL